MSAPLWLVLAVVVGTLLLVTSWAMIHGRRAKDITPKTMADLEVIENKLFERERVIIDGKKFIGCTFNEVKLICNGELFSFQHCKFGSGLTVGSDKDSFETFVTLLHELGFLAIPVKDKDGNLVARNTRGSPGKPADD